ncbi:MAG: hypothetical protein ACK52I_11500 [Pseudomonadota bacterium]
MVSPSACDAGGPDARPRAGRRRLGSRYPRRSAACNLAHLRVVQASAMPEPGPRLGRRRRPRRRVARIAAGAPLPSTRVARRE